MVYHVLSTKCSSKTMRHRGRQPRSPSNKKVSSRSVAKEQLAPAITSTAEIIGEKQCDGDVTGM